MLPPKNESQLYEAVMRINHMQSNINITSGMKPPDAAVVLWQTIALFVTKRCTDTAATAAVSNQRDCWTRSIQLFVSFVLDGHFYCLTSQLGPTGAAR